MALERVHDGPSRRPGGVVVIETGAPSGAATAAPTEAAVRAALAEVRDPELPVVSVVDLGIVEGVDVAGGRIAVELIPTFIGCPALELIEASVAQRLASFGVPVEVGFTRRVPWTSERITAAGPAPRRGHRAAARPGQHALPVVRLGAGRHGQRVRADAVPLNVLLPRLPPAVRSAQAHLRSTAREARRTTAARRGRCSVGPPIEIERPAGSTRDARSADRSRAKGTPW